MRTTLPSCPSLQLDAISNAENVFPSSYRHEFFTSSANNTSLTHSMNDSFSSQSTTRDVEIMFDEGGSQDPIGVFHFSGQSWVASQIVDLAYLSALCAKLATMMGVSSRVIALSGTTIVGPFNEHPIYQLMMKSDQGRAIAKQMREDLIQSLGKGNESIATVVNESGITMIATPITASGHTISYWLMSMMSPAEFNEEAWAGFPDLSKLKSLMSKETSKSSIEIAALRSSIEIIAKAAGKTTTERLRAAIAKAQLTRTTRFHRVVENELGRLRRELSQLDETVKATPVQRLAGVVQRVRSLDVVDGDVLGDIDSILTDIGIGRTHLDRSLHNELWTWFPSEYMTDSETRGFSYTEHSGMSNLDRPLTPLSPGIGVKSPLSRNMALQLQHEDSIDEAPIMIDSINFDVFELAKHAQSPLKVVSTTVFEALDLIHTFSIDRDTLDCFMDEVVSHYSDLPYHNEQHAADVLQMMFLLLTRPENRRLSPIEVFACVFAAITHDAGHRGLSSLFLNRTGDDLAKTYNDQSPLENYHAFVAFQITTNPAADILSTIRSDDAQFRRFRSVVVNMVLVTDLGANMSLLDRLRARLRTSQPWNPAPKSLPMDCYRLLMVCCDVFNPARALDVAVEWGRRVQEEFYFQGDQEIAHGLEMEKFHDRANPEPARCQVGFISFIVRPLAELLFHENALDDTLGAVAAINRTLEHQMSLLVKSDAS
ncbi:3'5'-cyclic nucleotide phosphodiesterase [Carpediemonas membranifera]|uniref:3'5'-cyclic nucleotide phosphodiesterase n=1 Tax=Carpediemonas membranifera TaxID=201153 RepID=A0A8J6BU54_9EUKA|nr:3'5'-cyclic nucleotide phosphodiesterase [Carpediemonas membranifera]|eukprot:KAG9389991.1 3'5'-cyclic nucleotide phosphodiesterase [Carpediemonas membranifera]